MIIRSVTQEREEGLTGGSLRLGIYVLLDLRLLKKAQTAQEQGARAGRSRPGLSRRSTILPDFVGLTFSVYNGPQVRAGLGQRGHGRHEARRVRADPVLPGHAAKPRRVSANGQACGPVRSATKGSPCRRPPRLGG